MHWIERVEILGFRGMEKLVLAFHPDVNFLIGRNGTGKTTLINLISAAITADQPFLARARFTSLRIVLRRAGSRSRPVIALKKIIDDDGDVVLKYDLYEQSSGSPQSFELLATTEAATLRLWHTMRSVRSRPWESYEEPQVRVATSIARFVNVTWLSILRSPKSVSETEEKFESHIDRKLHQVSNEFSGYFSVLDNKASQASDRFQQNYLLSLISPPKFDFYSDSVKKIEATSERSAIREMFREFNLKPTVYERKLDQFIRKMSTATKKYVPGSVVDANDFLVITDTMRIHDLVGEWNKLNIERDKIYQPKADFISIINDLLYKKRIKINVANRPVFEDFDGNEIPMMSLSSGEKQLFIILGESLLQRGRQCVFMADEPEISLHVAWQENLVPSLIKINPNAQVIFATHSPDIVGRYQKRTVNLEKVIG